MIHFPATFEIILCLIGSIVIGFIFGWLFGSTLAAVIAGIGFFCWSLDMVFSFDMIDDGSYDDDEY